LAQIATGDLEIFAFGKIIYRDVFDVPHWINFCGRYSADGYIACEDYGGADENRP
jgi:hypothetical protein